jgi:hypothetical protein
VVAADVTVSLLETRVAFPDETFSLPPEVRAGAVDPTDATLAVDQEPSD